MRPCLHYKTVNLDYIKSQLVQILPTKFLLCCICEPKLSQMLESLSQSHLKQLMEQKQMHDDNTNKNLQINLENSQRNRIQQNQYENNNVSASLGNNLDITNTSSQLRPLKPTMLTEFESNIKLKYNNGSYVCLTCLSNSCGINDKQHAQDHFQQNPEHHLAIQSKSLDVWCYTCDIFINDAPGLTLDQDQDEYKLVKKFIENISLVFREHATGQSIMEAPYLPKELNIHSPLNPVKKGIMIKSTDQVTKQGSLSKQSYNTFKKVTIRENESQIFHLGNGGFSEIHSRLSEEDRALELMSEDQIQSRILCYRGMQNLGNTCFFNSTIQCLNASRSLILTYVIPRDSDFIYQGPESINLQLRNLFFEIRKQRGVYNPKDFFALICKKNSRFRGFQQQDAHDLLLNMFDMLQNEHDNELKRSKEEKMRGIQKSLVEEVFGGYFLNTVLCLECQRVSRTREPALDISLTISFKNQNNQFMNPTLGFNAPRMNNKNKANSGMNFMQKIFCSCKLRKREKTVNSIKQVASEQTTNQQLHLPQLSQVTLKETPKVNQKKKKGSIDAESDITKVETPSRMPHRIEETNMRSSFVYNQSSRDPETTHGASNQLEVNRSPSKYELEERAKSLPHFQFEDGKRFSLMNEMHKIPYYSDENQDKFYYFEPRSQDEPLDDNSLEGCLFYHSRIEKLFDKSNLYHCELCTRDKYPDQVKKRYKTHALKRYLLIDPPNNLVINLKRFTQSAFTFYKNCKRVTFPLELNLDNYLIHKVMQNDQQSFDQYLNAKMNEPWTPQYKYRLYGVVSHAGGMGGGHYVAYVNYEYKEDNYWFYMSDTFVDRVDVDKVLACEAYILFYKRILD
eukprot:403331397